MATLKKVARYILFFFPYGPVLGVILVYVIGDLVNSLPIKIIIFFAAWIPVLYFGIKQKMLTEIILDSKKVMKWLKKRKEKEKPQP